MKPTNQAAVIEAFQSYARAFQTLDPSAVASHFHQPALMISPRGVVGLSDAAAIERTYQGVMAELVKSAYERTDFRNLTERQLSDELTVVNGSGAWINRAGQQFSTFGLSYTFRFTERQWLIVVAVIHDADR